MPHTPAPWIVQPGVWLDGTRVVSGDGHIASLRATPHRLADARLIAAAPDLLEACKSVFAGLQAKADIRGSQWTVTDQEDYETLRAAIKNAEGRP